MINKLFFTTLLIFIIFLINKYKSKVEYFTNFNCEQGEKCPAGMNPMKCRTICSNKNK